MDLQFGQYQLKRAERLVLGPAGAIELSARSFDILALLLDKPDDVIGKSDLFDAVWPGQIVEENTLQVHISSLRKALDMGMITTVHGRGYKYAGPRPTVCAEQAARPQHIVSDHKPMIVVLPFENLSGDPDQQYFSDGITGDIADRLARFGIFAVIGQHSAASFRQTAPDFTVIRERLNVDFVVTGNVRCSSDRIRFAVRLSDAASEQVIWGERYDRPMTDLFDLQDEVSELVVAAIARHLEVEINVRSVSRPHTSLSSYEHLLQGYWHFKKLTRAGAAAAMKSFERAVELDPGNAEALGWLGVTHCEGWVMDFRVESAAKGVELTAQAIALDPTNVLSHSTHTWAQLCFGDLAGALRSGERGVALNAGDPNVLVNYAVALGYAGSTIEAKDLMQRAGRLEPIPPPWFGEFSGIIAFADGRYEDALTKLEHLSDMALDEMYTLACCGLLGEKQKARAIITRQGGASRKPDWALGISRQPFRDLAIREQLSEGVAKALSF